MAGSRPLCDRPESDEPYPPADIRIERIADLANLDEARLLKGE